ncbi:MAG: hypothetical protein ACJAVK_003490 [Akkermansiaceae bacterium]|jgi:hypothetical protein
MGGGGPILDFLEETGDSENFDGSSEVVGEGWCCGRAGGCRSAR